MMRVYQCLDIIATLTEALGIYLFSICFCKKPRFRPSVNQWMIIGIFFGFTYILTWFSELGGYKAPIIFIFTVILVKICYKDSLYQCIVSQETAFIAVSMMSEGIGILSADLLYEGNIIVWIDGTSLMRWEVYVIVLCVRGLTFLGLYRMCRKYVYQVDPKDFVVITAIFFVGWISFVYSAVEHLNLHKQSDTLLYLVVAIFPFLFILIFMYVKNTAYLREQEQQGKMQIAKLSQQFTYYQNKEKDEERVRSIYHDMKNHLLVLEGSQGTEEVRKMARQLRTQISDYENYVRTGNEFLDMILKDKAAEAREKAIDFSASVDFENVDFIEPLDISTLFGNGIDNAIEASERLPEKQRVILLKAGKVQHFISIVIENNCADMKSKNRRRTTKKDGFLHGFGISNMRKAAEKYGGTCTTAQENGKFTLKILIPMPEMKEP